MSAPPDEDLLRLARAVREAARKLEASGMLGDAQVARELRGAHDAVAGWHQAWARGAARRAKEDAAGARHTIGPELVEAFISGED